MNSFLSAAEELAVKGLTAGDGSSLTPSKPANKRVAAANLVYFDDDDVENDDDISVLPKHPSWKSGKHQNNIATSTATTQKRKVVDVVDADDVDVKRIKAEPDQSGSGNDADSGATDFDAGNDEDDFESFHPFDADKLGPGTSGGGRRSLSESKELEVCSMSRTQRGHPYLLDVYGYSYTKNKEKANKTYWNCKYQTKFKCHARLHTDGLIVVYRSETQHCHDPVPITKNKYMEDDYAD